MLKCSLFPTVLWSDKSIRKTSVIFFSKIRGDSVKPASWRSYGGVLFICGLFCFYSFSKLLLGLRPCIWSCQFYLSQSWEQWGLCCSWGIAAGLCAGLAELKSVAQAWCLSVPQGHPSPCPCADKYSVFSFDPLMKSACFISDSWVMFLSLFSLFLS